MTANKIFIAIVGILVLLGAGFFLVNVLTSVKAPAPPPTAELPKTVPPPVKNLQTLKHNGIIAVSYQDDTDHFQIFTVSSDGATRKQLTNDGNGNVMPKWSPDGKKIAYVAQSPRGILIHTMNADGTNNQTISETQNRVSMGPDWSPDGVKIAYASGIPTPDKGNLKIWIMNADGSNKKQITTGTSDDNVPSWSPDGKQIAFTSDRENGKYRIWVMNADGSNLHALTTSSYDSVIGADVLQKVPAWSPDGKYIAYWNGVKLFELSQGWRSQTAPPTTRDKLIMATWHIWLMNTDGTNKRMLTPGDDPEWSPDSKLVMFPTPAADGSTHEPIGVGVINVDGTNRHNLFTVMGGGPQRFSWQPVR